MPIPTPSSRVHAKTGKLAWWYQEVPHDVWDYDACAPVMLFDAMDARRQDRSRRRPRPARSAMSSSSIA